MKREGWEIRNAEFGMMNEGRMKNEDGRSLTLFLKFSGHYLEKAPFGRCFLGIPGARRGRSCCAAQPALRECHRCAYPDIPTSICGNIYLFTAARYTFPCTSTLSRVKAACSVANGDSPIKGQSPEVDKKRPGKPVFCDPSCTKRFVFGDRLRRKRINVLYR